LKLEKKELKNHQVEIIAEVEIKRFENYKSIAARKISKESKIPGFRPGKAPYDVIQRIYGEELIEDRAVEELVNNIYPEIIKEAEIEPYGPGKLENIIDKNPPKYKFIIPLAPVVNIKDYIAVRHPYKLPKVQKKEIDQVLSDLQTNYATAEDVSRKSKIGDLVSVKINAVMQKPSKDEKSEILKDTPHQVILGEHKNEEQFPYKGFMDQLMDLEIGSKKEFEHKYSKDSQYENLQGKIVDFTIEVEAIKELIKPELNDEFAKMVGIDSFENLTQSVTDQLETGKRNEYDNEYFDKVLDKLISKATIKYPPEMLEAEIADVQKNFEQNLTQQNLDLDTYLKINKREKDDFIEKDIKPAALKRLEQSLVIEEFSKLEKIEIDQQDLQKEYSKSFLQMQSSPNYKKMQKQMTTKKMADALVMQAASRLLHQNSLARLKEIASGEAEKATKEESQKTENESSIKETIKKENVVVEEEKQKPE
jgi:trigger factor